MYVGTQYICDTNLARKELEVYTLKPKPCKTLNFWAAFYIRKYICISNLREGLAYFDKIIQKTVELFFNDN